MTKKIVANPVKFGAAKTANKILPCVFNAFMATNQISQTLLVFLVLLTIATIVAKMKKIADNVKNLISSTSKANVRNA